MILLTTSRRPTRGIRTFCKDFSHTIPNVTRINRGKLSLEGLVAKALELDAEKVVIVDRWRGGPGKIELFVLEEGELKPTPPLIYLRGVKLRRDFGTMPKGRRIKALAILAPLNFSQEISKFIKVLSEFFEIPIVSDLGECERFNAVMQFSTSPLGEIVATFRLLPENFEIGPRIRVSHLIWDLTHES